MGRRILIALVACLLALGAAEVVLRWTWDAPAARAEVERMRERVLAAIPGQGETARKGKVPHPYLGWDDGNRIEQLTNELGAMRRGHLRGEFVVLVLGGSVSALLAERGEPAMGAVLEGDPRLEGRKLRVLSHGRGSFKQPQQVMLAAYLFGLGYRPDVVLNVDGFNEVALGMHNASQNAHPFYPHWPSFTVVAGAREQAPEVLEATAALRAAQAELARVADEVLAGRRIESGFLGRAALRRVRDQAVRCVTLQEETLRRLREAVSSDPTLGPPLILLDPKLDGGGRESGVIEAITAGWVEASIQLDALARAHDIPYVHVLQPTLHDMGAKPLTRTEIERGKLHPTWLRGVELGYPKLRAAGGRLRERGIAFFDLTGIFQELEEEAYYDGCHFRGEAMRIFAEAAARAILETLPR